MSDETQEQVDYGDDQYSVYRKLMAVQRAITVIPKDGQNAKMKFKFTSSSGVLTKIREQMDKVGLLLLFDVKHHEVKENIAYRGQQALTLIDVAATWVDADNPASQVTLTWPGQGADDGEKGVGKALTYMEKYNILKMFHIPTDEVDPDADEAPDDEDAPDCPKCGKTMIQRYSSKNKDYFWGCSDFPKCKGTAPVGDGDDGGNSNRKSRVTTSETKPEDRKKKSSEERTEDLWGPTWEVICQALDVEKGDAKTVDKMKKWARRQTDGEIDKLSDWTPDMIIRFRGVVEKQLDNDDDEDDGDDEDE
jgi:ssDNA-binding Zn-finger/Zn-ribbon topoisomerase 1